jgi:hypothetical protein
VERRRKGDVVTCVIANMKNEALTAFVREAVFDKLGCFAPINRWMQEYSPMLICRRNYRQTSGRYCIAARGRDYSAQFISRSFKDEN